MSAPAPPAPAAPDTSVLIAGAGPTGLVLALWLTHLGIRVRLIDKASQPGANSRALAVQARTLELYSQLNLASAVVERGRHVTAINLWASAKKVTRAVFADMGAGLSPFPFALVFPQDEHERLLIDRLAALGVLVERQTELLGFEDAGDHILARLQLPGGVTQTCTASFIAGCDGAHSVVRQSLHIGFPGGEYTHLFYVADVQAGGPTVNGELHVGLDKTDFLAVFPFPEAGRVRLVGTVRNDQAERQRDQLSWQDVSQRVIDWIRIDVQHVNWFSTYRVHHRVAEHFRHQRAFLLGDAAHIHSPVGGQGMNTGIGDAINLAWKLAAVLHHQALPAILDTYEPERIAFARRLVATTDRAFTAVTSTGALARLLRLHIVPFFLPSFFRFAAMRRFLFRTVSQTAVNYRGSRLSQGRAGPVHGGDRLPWVLTGPADNPLGNFAPLSSLAWQLHIYGNVPSAVRALCEQRRLPLHLFPWHRGMRRAGLRPNALYLLRPDGYIALADPEASATQLAAYLDAHGLAPAHESLHPTGA
jgi:2-polyprenyl-6-methoxyphenol hydroxylase-like FAD-dependent oxidoreductase